MKRSASYALIPTTAPRKKKSKKNKPSLANSLTFSALNNAAGSVGKSAFPAKSFKTLRYIAQKTLTANPIASQYGQSAIFRANGIYDPDVALGGHQPMGFDQLMQYYKKYTVVRSRIRVMYSPDAVGNTDPVSVAVNLSRDYTDLLAITLGAWESLLEQPLTGNAVTMGTTVTGFHQGQRSCIPMHSFDAKKFFGQKTLDAQDYGGTALSDPTVPAYFTIATNNLNGVAAIITVRVELEYDVEFTEPNPLLGS